MLYHGFYVDFVPVINIPRVNEKGGILFCSGFEIKIYSDSERKNPVDGFYAAEGFEIVSATLDEAEQFAKDVIDIEQKSVFSK